MRISESETIPGLRRIEPTVFRDERGEFIETYNIDDYAFVREDGTAITFVEDDLSISRSRVLRGMHGDDRTYKLVTCVHGALHVVVVDCRRDRPSYLGKEAFELSGLRPLQLLIPPGCATGFVALEDRSVFGYKQSERYVAAGRQFTVRWNDSALSIDWPVEAPILSERDARAPDLVP
jgi:dTDP-4-dehydrorhamnose 3,5-epimerase